jgi:hypothetical protein
MPDIPSELGETFPRKNQPAKKLAGGDSPCENAPGAAVSHKNVNHFNKREPSGARGR